MAMLLCGLNLTSSFVGLALWPYLVWAYAGFTERGIGPSVAAAAVLLALSLLMNCVAVMVVLVIWSAF